MQLPKLSISPNNFQLIDRGGIDVTDLFCVKIAALEVSVDNSACQARLTFLLWDFIVVDDPNSSDNVRITHKNGWNLMDGLEPNTLDRSYPARRAEGYRPQITITFDVEWAD